MNQLPNKLKKDEELHFIQLAQNGDMDAKNKLIEHNLRLVYFFANKFRRRHVDIEDLVSVGSIGLIKGVQSFDPTKNVQLSTYISRCIQNELLMYFRKFNKQFDHFSLNSSFFQDEDGNEVSLLDTLGTEKESVENKMLIQENISEIFSLLDTLNDNEKTIIKLRFGIGCEPQLQSTISNLLNISQSYISRIEKRALEKLKIKFKQIS